MIRRRRINGTPRRRACTLPFDSAAQWQPLAISCQSRRQVQALHRVSVLEEVEERMTPSVVVHRWVLRPVVEHILRDASGKQQLREAVVPRRLTEPVGALSKSLEGASGAVHEVFADVGLLVEAQLPPTAERVTTERSFLSTRWLRVSEDLRAEVLPLKRPRVPLQAEPVDGLALLDVRLPHGHVEGVDHEDAIDLTAIAATAQLHFALT
mmetsp:Transcript_49521/g.146297  ORF Transcript_49521/g.146297 Transcript_49521/m.146297 type:complete len:210 (-) Transcript_49521:817-1446(-)